MLKSNLPYCPSSVMELKWSARVSVIISCCDQVIKEGQRPHIWHRDTLPFLYGCAWCERIKQNFIFDVDYTESRIVIRLLLRLHSRAAPALKAGCVCAAERWMWTVVHSLSFIIRSQSAWCIITDSSRVIRGAMHDLQTSICPHTFTAPLLGSGEQQSCTD